MPGEIVSTPNPSPLPSSLPKSILTDLAVNISLENVLSEDELHSIRTFRRAANYIAAAMIFLRSNVLVETDLKETDIKPRLLGHWGTCPGLTLVYAHLNRLVKKTGSNMIFVVGPGHGAPGILSSLWLEGSLGHFYPQYSRDKNGLENLIKGFSTPEGFPSHINAEVPGSIHEGGELGYALAVAFGAVMDKPDLLVTVVVGDGEAETGPTATAWHAAKYLDPAESGAVIPIVHVNGFKISERTIYGCMDDIELVALFTGYGYQVRIVGNEGLDRIDEDMAASMDWAVQEIRKIQKAARDGNPIVKPRWPVLILRTPKGWTGPKRYKGQIIEGSFKSHQVPIADAKKDDEGRKTLQEWLKSYEPAELFNEKGEPVQEILDLIPNNPMGQFRDTYNGHNPISAPDWQECAVEKGTQASSMKIVGKYLDKVFRKNLKAIRLFSPDELESNKLSSVLDNTSRNFQWSPSSRAKGGRVIEILSEHTCQGLLQGYTLTGRTALFPSYESFLGIVHTMMVQYSKFVKLAKEVPWRNQNASINYLETSTWARQEHNGFSHQNPSFIGAVLNLKPEMARVYLPPDANCFLATMHHCLESKDYTNLMVGSKQPTPVWLSKDEALDHCRKGASVWKFASTDNGEEPDVVLVGIGTEVTFEVVAAAALLRKLAPNFRVRVVNVTDLMILGPTGSHPHALEEDQFNELFTKDKWIIMNYHGYVNDVAGLVFGRKGVAERMIAAGYREEGSTTTPFDMMIVNRVSRYHVAMEALQRTKPDDADELVKKLQKELDDTKKYIMDNGEDVEGTYDTPSFD
ncbi:phosphoketolase [Pyronema domesticum]|uniref:Similar to Probable phosphoketolase acc. no. O74770 n=1 Tax=Pyronema omphalodes (strain CBS 100304) TaxID=1076935 RepID=U4LFX7_PYROM|nr:phosphoketolase [Pyronema domesticum]CCX30442.1 Similar to Probable phosphoketolase; acc. no. O74770 [Pyronema omphalodes CBS 100304]